MATDSNNNNQLLIDVKRLIFGAVIGLAGVLPVLSQQNPKGYEFEREMPLFLDQLKAELTYPMAWGNSPIEDFDAWRTAARATVTEAMLTPPPKSQNYRTEVIAEEKRDGYTCRKLTLNLTGYSRVYAYYLVPDGKGPFPTVLLLHDHGGHYSIGKEKMIRPFGVSEEKMKDAEDWAANCYGGQFLGDYLAAHGYAVFCTDALFWGDRGRKEGINGNKHMDIAGHFMMLGRSWSAFMNFEDMYATDYLTTLPEVDTERIGCAGFSMGAYRSWMLAALSDKIKTGVSICWMVDTGTQFSWEYGKENGGFANQLPGLRQYLDYPHIASMACPKPMYFLNGSTDKLFPEPGVKSAFAEMHKVWKDNRADNRLKTEIWDMSHNCGIKVQLSILDYLDQWLK